MRKSNSINPMKKIYPLLVCMILITSGVSLKAQHLYGVSQNSVSQFHQFSTLYNPAMAGVKEPFIASGLYRNMRIQGSPFTGLVNIDGASESAKSGFGFTGYFMDPDGHEGSGTIAAKGRYAKHFSLGRDNVFSVGADLGVLSQQQSAFGGVETSTVPTLGVGAAFKSHEFTAGISVQNINDPELTEISGDTRVNRMITANLGYKFEFDDYFALQPNALYIQGENFSEINVNGLVFIGENLYVGSGYRNVSFSGAGSINFVTITGGVYYNDLQFGYAYDHPMGQMTGATFGIHEIVFSFLIRD